MHVNNNPNKKFTSRPHTPGSIFVNNQYKIKKAGENQALVK